MNTSDFPETHLLNAGAHNAAARAVCIADPRIAGADAEDIASEALRAGLAFNTTDSVAGIDALATGSRLFSLRTNNMWTTYNEQRMRIEGTGGGYTYLHDFVKAEAPLLILHVAPIQ